VLHRAADTSAKHQTKICAMFEGIYVMQNISKDISPARQENYDFYGHLFSLISAQLRSRER
jgi:hypothetical protein